MNAPTGKGSRAAGEGEGDLSSGIIRKASEHTFGWSKSQDAASSRFPAMGKESSSSPKIKGVDRICAMRFLWKEVPRDELERINLTQGKLSANRDGMGTVDPSSITMVSKQSSRSVWSPFRVSSTSSHRSLVAMLMPIWEVDGIMRPYIRTPSRTYVLVKFSFERGCPHSQKHIRTASTPFLADSADTGRAGNVRGRFRCGRRGASAPG
jgi:hypothetical protein